MFSDFQSWIHKISWSLENHLPASKNIYKEISHSFTCICFSVTQKHATNSKVLVIARQILVPGPIVSAHKNVSFITTPLQNSAYFSPDKPYLYLKLIHRVLLHLNCVGPQVLLAEIKEKGLKDNNQHKYRIPWQTKHNFASEIIGIENENLAGILTTTKFIWAVTTIIVSITFPLHVNASVIITLEMLRTTSFSCENSVVIKIFLYFVIFLFCLIKQQTSCAVLFIWVIQTIIFLVTGEGGRHAALVVAGEEACPALLLLEHLLILLTGPHVLIQLHPKRTGTLSPQTLHSSSIRYREAEMGAIAVPFDTCMISCKNMYMYF